MPQLIEILKELLEAHLPYGIYDLERNCGICCDGQSADTPEFAVEAVGNREVDF